MNAILQQCVGIHNSDTLVVDVERLNAFRRVTQDMIDAFLEASKLHGCFRRVAYRIDGKIVATYDL